MRPIIDASTIEPLGERLLVKPYMKPECSAGGIIIPDTARYEKEWSHYEFVKASPKALEKLGLRSLHAGAILRTRFKVPVDSGFDDEADGARLMFLLAEEVEQIILWKNEESPAKTRTFDTNFMDGASYFGDGAWW